MATKLPSGVKKLIDTKIAEALREHATEHVKDMQVRQTGFDKFKKEINTLDKLHNDLASQVKDSHDRLVNSTADLLNVMMKDITDLEADVEDLKDRFNTLSERFMQHLEAGG